MHVAHESANARGWRSLLCIAASLAAILLTVGTVGTASADCTTGGSGCLPNGGYTVEYNWNCGAITDPTRCYYYNTTDVSLATAQTFGWASAAYNGAGTVSLCMHAAGYFSACGTNIARGCYYANCVDQSGVSMKVDVQNYTGTHTVVGHAWS